MRKIVFDENVPNGIVDALISLFPFSTDRKMDITSVHLLGQRSASDEDVLHLVGKNGAIITYDKDFKTHKALSHIIKENKIGCFWVRQPHKTNFLDLAKTLVSHWDKILKIANDEQKPFLYEVTKKGVEKRTL
jgi:predicted nuclease of predicted toxin-antitoxin system